MDSFELGQAIYQAGDLASDNPAAATAQLRTLLSQLEAAEGAGTAAPGPPGAGAGQQQPPGTTDQQQPTTPASVTDLANQLPELRRSHMATLAGGATDLNAGDRRQAQERLADFGASLNAALDGEAASIEAERQGLRVNLPGNAPQPAALGLDELKAQLAAAAANPGQVDAHFLTEVFNKSMDRLSRQVEAELGR